MEGRQDTESKTLMKNVDGIGAFLFVKAIRPTLAWPIATYRLGEPATPIAPCKRCHTQRGPYGSLRYCQDVRAQEAQEDVFGLDNRMAKTDSMQRVGGLPASEYVVLGVERIRIFLRPDAWM